MVMPMRQETLDMGLSELLTAEDVESFLADKTGTKLLFYNSVCGCAAGGARPGLRLALASDTTPDQMASLFTGMEISAVEAARAAFPEIPGTSPAVGLIKDGEMVYWMPRHAIEGRMPQEIAAELVDAFNKFCAKTPA
ncbi:MAG: BrxA/BrxB family bacilliredoxin [Planctomycetota bacterium]